MILQRVGALEHAPPFHPFQGVVQCDPGAGDRGGAGAAIGLQHVAVDDDRVLAERLRVDDGPQRAPDQSRDLVGATADAALDALSVVPAVRGAREHGVLGRDPALALAGQPARDAVGEGGGAQHLGAAEADQCRSLGVRAPTALDRDLTKLIGGAAVDADDFRHVLLSGRDGGANRSDSIRVTRKRSRGG